jgi:uncharacterized membrane protein
VNVIIDPLWPWSALWSYLTNAGPVAVATVLTAAALALAVPVVAHFRGGLTRRTCVRGATLVVIVLLLGLGLGPIGMSGGMAVRAQGMGLALLAIVPLALVGLTVWTYLGVPGATRRRVGVVLTLRLLAFLLVLLALLRPALGFPDVNQLRSVLLIGVDASRSMGIQDEVGNQSRWELVLRQLRDSAPLLERLRDEQQTDIVLVAFGDKVASFNPDAPSSPEGKRTETGALLRELYERREAGRPLRGLLILSDGADNGTIPALSEAGRWRNLPCPVQTFALGNPTIGQHQNDIALTAITPVPAPVPVKGKLTVKLLIDAPGFEHSTVRLRAFLDGKEVAAKDEALPLTAGNEVKLECTAPATPGEVRLRVTAEDPNRPGEPPAGDLLPANNTIETFVTVTKGGINVLYVDKRRGFEPQLICDALDRDPRIRRNTVWLSGERPLDANAGDLFQFDRQQYDVIILGDVTARQVTAVSPGALEAMEKQVYAGAGFLMLGGYSAFDNGDWQTTPVERLLPVELAEGRRGQVEEEVKVVPTDAGLRSFAYLLRLDDGKDPAAAWEKLPKLEGVVRLGPAKKLGTVLATAAGFDLPVLVSANYGKGRTLAFAGDTTHRWVRSEETARMHSRFWRQLVVWLARQEDAEGSVWVKPDTRRLPARGELRFAAGVRSKGGVDLPGGSYKVEVVGPTGVRTPVAMALSSSEAQGVFARTDAPGEYRVEVRAHARDPATREEVGNENKPEPAVARFLVYDEDLEMARRAADHEFLRKLAAAGGGEFHRADELPEHLRRLLQDPLSRTKPKLVLRPDWRSTGPSPFLGWLFGIFVALLSVEWFLRRRWGMA